MGHFASGVTIVTALREASARDDGHRGVLGVAGAAAGPGLRQQAAAGSTRRSRGRRLVRVAARRRPGAARPALLHRGRDLLTQFDHVPRQPAPVSGAPLLDGALAWLECTTYAQHDGGDHTIVVGQVVRASGCAGQRRTRRATPLTYYQGTYSPIRPDPR